MTPDHLHGIISIASMKRGKHVIMHKPIANRLKEARMVIDTAKQTGVATHFMPWDSNGSMEQIMACGLGPCYVCVRTFEVDGHKELRRVCIEGPVFDLQECVGW